MAPARRQSIPGELSKAAEALKAAGEQLNAELGNRAHSTGAISQLAATIGNLAPTGLYPSDYCYNRINKGSRWPPMFEQIEQGLYRYLGPQHPFTGPVYWRQAGTRDRPVGQWENGQLTLRIDPHLVVPGPDEPAVAGVEENQWETEAFESLLHSLALENSNRTLTFLARAIEHHREGNWDDAIGNLRKVLECVLREVAAAHSLRCRGTELGNARYRDSQDVRTYLQDEDLLARQETRALAAVYGLLSEYGAHANEASEDLAQLSRSLTLALSDFVMGRFQRALDE